MYSCGLPSPWIWWISLSLENLESPWASSHQTHSTVMAVESTMPRPLTLVLVHLTLVSSAKLCPSQCFCYDSAELVDCRARGFTHVPHGIPHGSWLLDLSGNAIPELRTRSFTGVWALKVLLLSNCGIKVMQSNVSGCVMAFFRMCVQAEIVE